MKTKQEQIEAIISKSCDDNGYALSEVEIALIALDLLKSGLIAFEKKITVNELEQGAVFKWGKKEYIKLDATSAGCLCLAKDVWFKSKFDDRTNDWSKSQLRGDIVIKASKFIPDIDKLMLFDRDLTTDDGLTDYKQRSDSVSMLTCDEYRKYRKFIPTTDERYWTITADSIIYSPFVRFIYSDGALNGGNTYCEHVGVRPLICLANDTIVEVKE